MQINSTKTIIQKDAVKTYQFLNDAKNFERLMPDNISKFEAFDSNQFLFALKGMPEITLKQTENTPNSYIKFGSAEGKINFSLEIFITEINATSAELGLEFKGEFNPMMAMMIKKPITSFLETLVTNAAEKI